MSTLLAINLNDISFKDSQAVKAKSDFYTTITIDIEAVILDWKLSIFSYEWLNKDGSIKNTEDLKESDQEKRKNVERDLRNKTSLERPVLGIGIQDNIEIGSGKAVLCTLAALGVPSIPVNIPKSNIDDFKDFCMK